MPTQTRLSRGPMAWNDTPSKIPIAPDSPNPLESRFGSLAMRNVTPIRRNNTKSMTNLRGEAQARAAEAAEIEGLAHQTPARQAIPLVGRGAQRSSIGSPGELASPYCEDISMISYVPTPAPARMRRGSLAPGPSSATSSTSSHGVSGQQGSSAGSDKTSGSNSGSHAGATGSMIPTATFTYREAATPAKWTMDDPDLPSPFIRRASTAPVPSVVERKPLGPSLHDNARSGTLTIPSRAPVAAKMSSVPRSKSGNLHQQVLKTNAGRVSGEGTGGKARAVGRG
jgi:NIMA (never in mitosis gene a)-related kinase